MSAACVNPPCRVQGRAEDLRAGGGSGFRSFTGTGRTLAGEQWSRAAAGAAAAGSYVQSARQLFLGIMKCNTAAMPSALPPPLRYAQAARWRRRRARLSRRCAPPPLPSTATASSRWTTASRAGVAGVAGCWELMARRGPPQNPVGGYLCAVDACDNNAARACHSRPSCRVDDPANGLFMQAIMRGQCPPELDPGDPHVQVGPCAAQLVRWPLLAAVRPPHCSGSSSYWQPAVSHLYHYLL